MISVRRTSMSRFTRLALKEVFDFAALLRGAPNAMIHRYLFSRTTVARHPELMLYGHNDPNARRLDSRVFDRNWKYRTRWSIYAGLYQTVFGDGPNSRPVWAELLNQETRNWGAKRSRRDGMTGIDRMFHDTRVSALRTYRAGLAAVRDGMQPEPRNDQAPGEDENLALPPVVYVY